MGKVIGALTLVLSIGLFLAALFLPAARIEGVQPGGAAFVIGYFCSGVVFWPSHLFCLLGWIRLARREPVEAAEYGAGALYGPLYWLWGFAGEFQTRSFPSGWAWLASVLFLVLGSVSLWPLDARRKQQGEARTDGMSE